jgi:hypothetical protein
LYSLRWPPVLAYTASGMVRIAPPALRLVKGGAVCLVIGALGAFWHYLASQSPSSPFYPGMLPGPVRRFAFWALAAGVVLPVAALFLEVAGAAAERQKRLALALLVGTALKLGGLFVGGLLGVYGVQIMDPRPSSVVVMSLRLVGEATLLWCLVAMARDLWHAPRDPGSPT